MQPEKANFNDGPDLLSRVRAEKKKICIAAGLVAIMIFMWVKVFSSGGSTVKNAGAQVVSQVPQQKQQGQAEISYVQLPVVSGRNDVLTRDIFDVASSSCFSTSGNTGSKEVAAGQEPDEIKLAKIAAKIQVNAIFTGDTPQAYVADELLSVGSILKVRYDKHIYEFTVKEINSNQVVLKWKDFVVTAQMSDTQPKK